MRMNQLACDLYEVRLQEPTGWRVIDRADPLLPIGGSEGDRMDDLVASVNGRPGDASAPFPHVASVRLGEPVVRELLKLRDDAP